MAKGAIFVSATFLCCAFIEFISTSEIGRSGTVGLNETQNGLLFPHVNEGEEICMRGLECFRFTKDFFHSLYRPFNFRPNDRYVIDTKFYLFTRRNPKEHILLTSDDLTSIKESPLNAKDGTKFIIHGFIDNRLYGKWMEEMKDNLLLHGEYNVFIVDWSSGNSPPYAKAAVNAMVVGAEVSLMIKNLQKVKGVSPMDCHIIGHSLGSHIAGYAGKSMKKTKLGRITAVDPAGPLFQYMPSPVRVDRMDADFVDVIHTDSQTILLLGLGMSQAVGHLDFYPNSGKQQPGCKKDVVRSVLLEGMAEATRRFIACNHQRAVDFFTYSINYHSAPPVGYHCSSWNLYTKGHCADCGKNGDKCAIMGMRASEYKPLKNDSRSLTLYLHTSGSAPYWIHQYHVTLKLLKPKTKFSDQKGTVTLILHGKYRSVKIELTPSAIELYHGASYKFVASSNGDPEPIQRISFTWSTSSWFNIFSRSELYVEFIKVHPMNIVMTGERRPCSLSFSAKPEKAIKSGSYITMTPLCARNSSVS